MAAKDKPELVWNPETCEMEPKTKAVTKKDK
jgi:hypothetical protein